MNTVVVSVVLFLIGFPGIARSAAVITYQQDPGGVQVTFNGGSLRWTGGTLSDYSLNGGWSSGGAGGASPSNYVTWSMWSPNYGLLSGTIGSVITNDQLDNYTSQTISVSAGTFAGASNVGIQFSRNGIFHITVPSGYSEGSPLAVSTAYFPGKTLADFSLSPDETITQTWSHAGGTDSFTITAVPEPGSTLFLVLGWSALLGGRRRARSSARLRLGLRPGC